MTWVERVHAIHEHSDRLAVIDESGAVSGRELIGKAVAAAEMLTALELPSGAPVPALLTTNADAVALLLAGAASNRPIAPLGPRQTAAELADVMRLSGAGVLLSEAQFGPTARAVADDVGVRAVAVPAFAPSHRPFRAAPGPTALYLHTAGTTGLPKRVGVSDGVLDARADLLAGLTGMGPGDRYATGSPLHHIGGLGNVLVALTIGAAVVCTSQFSYDWWRSLKTLRATHCLLVPTMIEMLLARGLLDAVPLKTLIYGASPITVETLRRVLEALPDVAIISLYGQTEGSPITSLDPFDHRRAIAEKLYLLGTVGRAVAGLRLRIEAPDDEGVGEVLAAGRHLSAMGDDGWLHTGDLGSLDADGYLTLCGRRNDMVIRGGENVYPVEIENVLTTHPEIAAAGVVGVPDRRLGETLAAFVVPADVASPPDVDELRSFARAALAGFKVPQYWYTVAELPLNSAGKVLRPRLRASHARQRDLAPLSSTEGMSST
jgi:acyl-CoA synthetase (AMP-forming)/AMP-acid ligase II